MSTTSDPLCNSLRVVLTDLLRRADLPEGTLMFFDANRICCQYKHETVFYLTCYPANCCRTENILKSHHLISNFAREKTQQLSNQDSPSATVWGILDEFVKSKQGAPVASTQIHHHPTMTPQTASSEGHSVTLSKDDCVVCMDSIRNVVLTPCHHLALCSKCAKNVPKECPICRKEVQEIQEVFLC